MMTGVKSKNKKHDINFAIDEEFLKSYPIYREFDRIIKRLDITDIENSRRFEKLKNNTNTRDTIVDDKFLHIDKRFEQVDKRFEQVDKRFEQVDKRFEQVELRLSNVEAKLNYLIGKVENMPGYAQLIALLTLFSSIIIGSIKLLPNF